MSLTAALEALAELGNTADAMAKRAASVQMVGVWLSLRGTSSTLDAAYVNLEDHGDSYLLVAWDFIDAARRQLAYWRRVLGGVQQATT